MVFQDRLIVGPYYRCHLPVRAGRSPLSDRAARMMRRDLKAARIAYRDRSDRVADFHALRHTFITRLTRSGVMPAAAMKPARHKSIAMTMEY